MPAPDASIPNPGRDPGPVAGSGLRGTSGASVVAEVLEEHETARGWDYLLALLWPDDERTVHTVTLSWVDHDFWCGGAAAPERVVSAVVRLAAGAVGRERLPRRFDCATLRRILPDLDEWVQRLL